MLDQNTDRMWFVIGALVVGAGIILLANKTMPEIFASVADSFENLIVSVDHVGQPRNYFQLPFDFDERRESIHDVYAMDLVLKPNTEYTLSTNTPHYRTLYFKSLSENDRTYDIQHRTRTTDINGRITVYIVKDRENTDEVLNETYWVMLAEGSEPISLDEE